MQNSDKGKIKYIVKMRRGLPEGDVNGWYLVIGYMHSWFISKSGAFVVKHGEYVAIGEEEGCVYKVDNEFVESIKKSKKCPNCSAILDVGGAVYKGNKHRLFYCWNCGFKLIE
jgi:hypothetical protein